MLKKFILIILASALIGKLSAQSSPPRQKGLATISQQQMSGPMEFLSSDLLEGREAGTRSAYLAAEYIASHFKSLGLKTVDGTQPSSLHDYLQGVKLVSENISDATLSLSQNGLTIIFKQNVDFSPLRVHHSLKADAQVIFGGYGMSKDLLGKHAQKMSGKILIRAKGYPGSQDSTSAGYHHFSKLSSSKLDQDKNTAAKEAGIIAIFEFDPLHAVPFSGSTAQPDVYAEKKMTTHSSGIYKRTIRLANAPLRTEIPVFTISHRILGAIEPNWKTELRNQDLDLPPKKNTPKNRITAQVSTTFKRELFNCHNVVGCLEGKNPNEIVVVGAHYDHLGFYDGYLWNGADDNASGTVGVMALARAFVKSGKKPERTLIFAAWTGEERGLHGSTHFIQSFNHRDKIVYYHNYDMIGRSANPDKPDSNVSLIYTKAWKEAENLCKKNNATYSLGLNIRFGAVENPVGGSDNAPFAKKGIPIMWFHTGGHPDYHKPSDHADKIDWKKLEAIVKLSFLDLWDLSM